MGVLPQVMSRFIGFSAYQLDSNLRNSALVRLVCGSGIGATPFTAFGIRRASCCSSSSG
jgi:ABC-type phosphate/phosphonate transport system permease subunit